MMRKKAEEAEWVYDSSVDHKGRLPLRARTGVWKASLFIIAIEFSERLSYFGIATSLIIYLTEVIHQDLKTAARSVNYWIGVTTLMPLFGGFLADAYFGRFSTVLLSSIIYLMPSEDKNKVHEIVFFLGIYLISIGTGGHKPSLESFGADQFEDDHSEERKQKMSFFNWWNLGLCSGILFGVTLIVYVEDHVSYGVADVILALVMATSLVIFIVGRPFYRYRSPSGSPLTPMLQVVVSAVRKRKLQCPDDPCQLYHLSKSHMEQGRILSHTTKLKFLDKAAILETTENYNEQHNPWRLSTVTKVEETKLIINMIPIWLSTIPFGICATQATTFFIKQGAISNRNICNRLVIPPSSMYALTAITIIICLTIYEKILVPTLRKLTGKERGIQILQRIGIGMVFSIATMVVSALVERKRLSIVKNEEVMSVFWLAPQFVIIGIGDGFTLVGLQEYFYDQVPDSMRSLGIAFYLSVIGAANFVTSLLITAVDHVTGKYGKSWFGNELNSSRLDNFYWLLAAITTANVLVYVFLARRYSYKTVEGRSAVAHCSLDNVDSHSMA
ncbi:protein NRT1/ PTR FAMILY 5.6-like isoform X2 [Euphorbia lathyris]|uniref:protein NRT1/ PTR FAMILY 5.6-like isoform X2 n=1 Tax=Euphorbia lathyris TaxID=212925 RepID=UPI003313AA60